MMISRPLRSLTSKLRGEATFSGKEQDGDEKDVPVDVVVKDLDVARLELAWGLLRLGYKHSGVGLADHEAFFSLPLEVVTAHHRDHRGLHGDRMGEDDGVLTLPI